MKSAPRPALSLPLRGARTSRGGSGCRPLPVLMVALGWGAWTVSLCARALPPGPPDRYLFLVETSEAMRPRAAAAFRAVETLLDSGLHGQMRSGETLGVWTYNEALHAGELPLQVWTPQTGPLVTSNVIGFLKSLPFEKTAHLSAVWPELEELARDSPRLTVIWVTSGVEPIRGTPFDAQINEFFSAHARAQERARMPFIIVLRAQQGAYCAMTPNLAPWPALLPSFPPWVARAKPAEPPAAAKPAPKPAESKPAEKTTPAPAAPARAEPIVRPPLIIVGKKDEPATPSAPATESAAPTPGTPATVVEEKKPTPPAPAERAAPAPDAQPVAAPPPAPPPATPAPPPAEPRATPTPEPVPPPSRPAPPAEITAPAVAPAVPPVAEAKTTPPATVASRPESLVIVSESPPSAQPAPAVATATPGAPARRALWWTWVAGGLCTVGALVLWLIIRRSRAAHRASLITRSMDANRRPPP